MHVKLSWTRSHIDVVLYTALPNIAGVHANFDNMTSKEASKRITTRELHKPSPPTQKQLDTLAKLKHQGPPPKTKAAATKKITELLAKANKPTQEQLDLIEKHHLADNLDVNTLTREQASNLIGKACHPKHGPKRASTTQPATQPHASVPSPSNSAATTSEDGTTAEPATSSTDDEEDGSWLTSAAEQTEAAESGSTESDWEESESDTCSDEKASEETDEDE